jgi:hypothetical protein
MFQSLSEMIKRTCLYEFTLKKRKIDFYHDFFKACSFFYNNFTLLKLYLTFKFHLYLHFPNLQKDKFNIA